MITSLIKRIQIICCKVKIMFCFSTNVFLIASIKLSFYRLLFVFDNICIPNTYIKMILTNEECC